MTQNGSSIYNLCVKALSQFKDDLYWVPGNGKLISLWHDRVLGKTPPQIPRLQQWIVALGMKTIWDISKWETEEPYRWVGWNLPECPVELEAEKSLLFVHLARLAPIGKNSKHRRGWGGQSGRYSTSEGYQCYAANYNVPVNPHL